MQNDLNTLKQTRLVDIIHMPADQAVAMLATLPESLGEAIAKLCYQQIAQQK